MQKFNRKSITILGLSASLILSACGGDDDKADAGVTNADATIDSGSNTPPDSGPAADSGPRADTGPAQMRDAGHYCAPNSGVSVDGEKVTLAEASGLINSSAAVNCIDEVPPRDVAGAITMRACINVLGATNAEVEADLSELEIAIFYHKDVATGMTVDPSFTATTGVDRQPALRVETDVNRIRNPACPTGLEFELGRQSTASNTVKAAIDYTLRLRSKTSTGTWATVYHHRTKVLADRIIGGGASPSNCSPTDCVGVINLYAVRKAELKAYAVSGSATISGIDDLGDGVGEGHALVVSADCQLTPMTGAVSGFAPVPQVASYLIGGAFDTSASSTDNSGLFLGLGFDTATEARAAVGIMRHENTCTEAFAGDSFKIYPDAITVYGASPTTTLNQR
jgi:hypothetical protein